MSADLILAILRMKKSSMSEMTMTTIYLTTRRVQTEQQEKKMTTTRPTTKKNGSSPSLATQAKKKPLKQTLSPRLLPK